MAWLRYVFYFVFISLVFWGLTQLEVSSPGSLKFQVFADASDTLGTSEYSPIEIIQPMIIAICGLLMAWVALFYPSQRPLAIPFGGLAIVFFIRELDYFLDRLVADNFWQVLIGLIAALVIAYTLRSRRRLRITLARVWPSPGLVLLFAGAVILFSFVRFIGHEPLWQAIMGSGYQRVVKLALEEFIELIGYLFWLIGSIEYAYQVRATATRQPLPAAVRRRQTRLGRRS
jgi:hypothetical protein